MRAVNQLWCSMLSARSENEGSWVQILQLAPLIFPTIVLQYLFFLSVREFWGRNIFNNFRCYLDENVGEVSICMKLKSAWKICFVYVYPNNFVIFSIDNLFFYCNENVLINIRYMHEKKNLVA